MINLKKPTLLFSAICAAILLLATPKSAMAANRDFYDISKTPPILYSNADLQSEESKLDALITATEDHPTFMVYEFSGQYYNYAKLFANYQIAHNSGQSPTQAFIFALENTIPLPAPKK
ncbi:hypothetical protein ACJDT4_09090 [Clostridium neuense]|uniref:Uncharacterized protein n=1 Tax=Clostridium neuense TaxID=1728934 RepID=A0ABW8TI23_9CLOT